MRESRFQAILSLPPPSRYMRLLKACYTEYPKLKAVQVFERLTSLGIQSVRQDNTYTELIFIFTATIAYLCIFAI